MSGGADGSALERLRAELELEGPPLADSLRPLEPTAGAPLAALVAGGSRTQRDSAAYGLLIESIFEGYLLHYGESRLLATDDGDLRLLAGDYLYAFGLARLAGIGDLEAVDELADLITLCAQAHSEGSGARLARALWVLTALAVRDGGWPAQLQAKERARNDGGRAAAGALGVAIERAGALGVEIETERALIAFDLLAAS
jgi:hypothetical protein